MRRGQGIVLGVLVLGLVLMAAQTASAKLITGNKRANNLVGTTRADRIEARRGADAVTGRARRDRIHGNGGADAILGGRGWDLIWGDSGDDVLDGGPGNDRIWAGWGADAVEAGSGNDRVYSDANDGVIDSIDCGPGYDVVVRGRGRGDRLFNCESVTQLLRGARVPAGRTWYDPAGTSDVWQGWDVFDYMLAMGGDDTLYGGQLHDILWGDAGNDILRGEHGQDWILGGPGVDQLFGGDGSGKDHGADRLLGGLGADEFYGEGGDDVLYSISVDGAADKIDCGAGFDRVFYRVEDVVVGCEWKRLLRFS